MRSWLTLTKMRSLMRRSSLVRKYNIVSVVTLSQLYWCCVHSHLPACLSCSDNLEAVIMRSGPANILVTVILIIKTLPLGWNCSSVPAQDTSSSSSPIRKFLPERFPSFSSRNQNQHQIWIRGKEERKKIIWNLIWLSKTFTLKNDWSLLESPNDTINYHLFGWTYSASKK